MTNLRLNVPAGRIVAFAVLSLMLAAPLLIYATPSFGPQHAATNAVVDIRLVLDREIINPGDQFNVAIQVEPNGQAVAGVQTFIDFDPSVLQVSGLLLGDDSPLAVVLLNKVLNDKGEIDFAAGSFTSSPDSTFIVANITFVAGSSDAATTLSFSRESPRQTLASIGADEVQRNLIDVEIIIGNPLPTPTPSPTPDPTPTPTITNTPTATPTALPSTPTKTATPTPTPTPTPISTSVSIPT